MYMYDLAQIEELVCKFFFSKYSAASRQKYILDKMFSNKKTIKRLSKGFTIDNKNANIL